MSTFFREKSRKQSNLSEKLTKTFKTDVILANFAFFVKFCKKTKNAPSTVARGPVPRDLPKKTAFFERSARACPSRSPDLCENRPWLRCLRTVSVTTEAWRGTGPRPTVRGAGLSRSARAVTPKLCPLCSLAAEMSTVPRDLSTATKNARSPEAANVFDRIGHGEAQALALR